MVRSTGKLADVARLVSAHRLDVVRGGGGTIRTYSNVIVVINPLTAL
jgi:hypothetical protein